MPQNPSIGPLSMHLAILDILCVIPAASSLAWKFRLVYWNPRSEWHRDVAPGLETIALSNVLKTRRLSLWSLITYATIRRSYRSSIALRYTLCLSLFSSYHLNSVTSVNHFWFGASAVKFLFNMLSAINWGFIACLVHPLLEYLIVDLIPFLRQIRSTRLSFALIPW